MNCESFQEIRDNGAEAEFCAFGSETQGRRLLAKKLLNPKP